MFVAKVKFKVQAVNSYTIGEICTLFEKDSIYCKYRYNKNDTFEFVLGLFEDKHIAFEYGKRLYATLLILLHIEQLPFKLPTFDFDKNEMSLTGCHLNQNGIGEEPDKFYFSNKTFFNNCEGLEIFEVENDFFEEYDSYEFFNKSPLTLITSCSTNHKYDFEMLKNIQIQYNEDSYRIFKVLELYETERETSIQSLLLCVAFETMANMEIRDIKNKYNKSKELDEFDKKFLDEFIELEKEQSVMKKCRILIKKYSKTPKKDNQVFKELYNIRSIVTHGELLPTEINLYQIVHNAKALFFRLFIAKFKVEGNNEIK